MPRFKYRNLLIDVLPESDQGRMAREAPCPWDSCAITGCLGCTGQITVLCGGASNCGGACSLQVTDVPCDFSCSQQPSGACLPCTNITNVGQRGMSNPEGLALLKERLRDALAEVEAHERVMNERLRPQNLSQVEALEDELTAALEDLRAQKEQLQRSERAGEHDGQ